MGAVVIGGLIVLIVASRYSSQLTCSHTTGFSAGLTAYLQASECFHGVGAILAGCPSLGGLESRVCVHVHMCGIRFLVVWVCRCDWCE